LCCWVLDECSWCSSFFLCLICVSWVFFCVFFMFNLFLFCFGLFSGQTSQVKPSRIKTGSVFYTLFVFFFQCFELLCCEPLPLKAQSQFTLLVNNDLVEWFCFCFFNNYLQLLSRKHTVDVFTLNCCRKIPYFPHQLRYGTQGFGEGNAASSLLGSCSRK
jgi:hypothetical protein